MNKKGFISMAVVYSFIIVFLMLLLSLITLYSFRNKTVSNEVKDTKDKLTNNLYKVTLEVINGTSDSDSKLIDTENNLVYINITPNEGYGLENAITSCENNSTIELTSTGVKISNITINDKCRVELVTNLPTLAEAILRDNIVSERDDFTHIITDGNGKIFKQSSSEEEPFTEDINGDGIGEDVYYYSGNDVSNNWVKFGKYQTDGPVIGNRTNDVSDGGYLEYETMEECIENSSEDTDCHYLYRKGDDMYFRIVRINEEGSVRILYSGTRPDTIEGYIGNSIYDYNYSGASYHFMGYMYDGTQTNMTVLEAIRRNTSSTTIKKYIDNWYKNNLLDSYDKYVSKSATYSSDRVHGESGRMESGSSFDASASYNRLNSHGLRPSYRSGVLYRNYKYTDTDTETYKDRFSVNTESGGNGLLTYGVALINIDEVAFAGNTGSGAWMNLNSNNESIMGTTRWWTMSPAMRWLGASGTEIFRIRGDKYSKEVETTKYVGTVRPVLSLLDCVRVKGNGTQDNPYEIFESVSCN